MSSKLHQSSAGAVTVHSVVAPSGELYAVKAGVVCWQVKLCDPHLSALEVRLSRRGAIQIDYLFTRTPLRVYACVCVCAVGHCTRRKRTLQTHACCLRNAYRTR